MKTKFTTFKRNMSGMLIFGILILSFASCMNPSDFTPSVIDGSKVEITGEVGVSGEVDVTGEVDVRFVDTAVLWIINTTASVDVEKVTVSRKDNPSGYPKEYSGPKNGSSLAAYHPPAEAIYNVEIEYKPVDPLPNITGVTKENTSAKTENVTLQMPRSDDYVIYIYRDDATKQIVIKQGDPKTLPDNTIDKANPPPPLPNPNGRDKNSSALVIHNMTKSATITGIDFTLVPNGGIYSYGDEIKAGEMNAAFLNAGIYYATINYDVSKKPAQVKDIVEVPASGVGHAYFYLGTDKKYYLVQNWSSLPIPPDPENTVSSDVFNGVKVRVTNKAASPLEVMAVGIRAATNSNQEPDIIVDSPMFDPKGPISRPDAKVAYFDEEVFKTKNLSVYGVYIVTVYVNKGNNSGKVEFSGKNFYDGCIISIDITDRDVAVLEKGWDSRKPPEDIPPSVSPPARSDDPDIIKIDKGSIYNTVAGGIWNSSLAIKGDGSLWAWGHNDYGKLATGNTAGKTTPTATNTGVSATGWKTISAGYVNSAGIKENGSLWVWGYNADGQLGRSGPHSYSPVQILPGTEWKSVSVGVYHVVAIRKDGTLWAWGYGGGYVLGQGDGTSRGTPTQIKISGVPDNNWVKVSAREYTNLALDGNGNLYAWGRNHYGVLGDGTSTDRSRPVQIGTGYTWKDMSAGYYHSAAITTGGDLYTWGYNNGRLGNGGTGGSYSPVKIGSSGEWSAVAVGYYHTVAVKEDSTLWAWGEHNGYGEIGDGTFINKIIPVQIAQDSKGWVSVVAGRHHSLAIRVDGSLWAWGQNNNGQLGMGDTTNLNTPVKVIYKP